MKLRTKATIGLIPFLLGLLVTMRTRAASAQIGDIFEPINHLFNGLFLGALDLILFLFVIVLVLGLFSAPLWLKKIFGWAKGA